MGDGIRETGFALLRKENQPRKFELAGLVPLGASVSTRSKPCLTPPTRKRSLGKRFFPRQLNGAFPKCHAFYWL